MITNATSIVSKQNTSSLSQHFPQCEEVKTNYNGTLNLFAMRFLKGRSYKNKRYMKMDEN